MEDRVKAHCFNPTSMGMHMPAIKSLKLGFICLIYDFITMLFLAILLKCGSNIFHRLSFRSS